MRPRPKSTSRTRSPDNSPHRRPVYARTRINSPNPSPAGLVPTASASAATCSCVRNFLCDFDCLGSFNRTAGLAGIRPSSTASCNPAESTLTIFRTEPGLWVALSRDAHCCACSRPRSASAMFPSAGMMWLRTTPCTRSSVDSRRSDRLSSHAVIQSAIVTRALVGSMYRPVLLATSTEARNSSASRLVLNPGLSVWLRSGLR